MTKGESTRQYIIEKAAPIFNKLGYETSFSDVGEATGLERGGITRHFKSKEDLAKSVFDYSYRAATSAKFGHLRELETGLAKLEGLIQAFGQRRSPISGGCPVYNTAVEHDDKNLSLKKLAKRAFEDWVVEVAGFVDLAKKQGAIRKNVDSRLLAHFILVSLEGAQIAKNLTAEDSLQADIANELLRYLETKKTC